jgi:hypothetical protein
MQRLTLLLADPDVNTERSPGSAESACSTSHLIKSDPGTPDRPSYNRTGGLISRVIGDIRDPNPDREMFTPRGSVLPALADGAGTRKNLLYNEYQNFMKSSIPMSE